MSAVWSGCGDDATRKRLQTLSASIASRSERVLTQYIPETILDLNDYLAGIDQDKANPFHDSQLDKLLSLPLTAGSATEAPSKKRKLAETEQVNGHVPNDVSVPSPQPLVDVFAYLRTHYEQQAQAMDDLKVWLTLQIPKLEDGDNSGVQVQEECLAELSRAQDSALNLVDAQNKFWAMRAKLASKVLKYPTIEDYQRSMRELDKNQFRLSRQRVLDLRNVLLFILDMLVKNMERIKKPRAENARTMY